VRLGLILVSPAVVEVIRDTSGDDCADNGNRDLHDLADLIPILSADQPADENDEETDEPSEDESGAHNLLHEESPLSGMRRGWWEIARSLVGSYRTDI
jgi:hypothetical protein